MTCTCTNGAFDATCVTSLTRLPAASKYTRHAYTKQSRNKKIEETLVYEAVKVCKLVQRQQKRPEKLKNVFRFKYLGTTFTVDTKQKYDIKTRIVKDLSRCGDLRNVIDHKGLPIKLKLRLYQAAVCSSYTHL